MKLSIVIPVYRVELTLERCIESVVSQNLDDYELILVDDGSPDNSGLICDRWAALSSRVTVIHQPNGGLSQARNTGIDCAAGEYITFVDSDDFVDKDSYRQLMDILSRHNEYDILEYPVEKWFGSPRQCLLTFEDRTYTDNTEYWLEGQGYDHCYAWNKIFRRSLFNHTRFARNCIFEDALLMVQLLDTRLVIATCSKGRYIYCWNDAGITSTADGDALRQLLKAHLSILPRLTDQRSEKFTRYYGRVANIQIDVCELTGDRPALPRKNIPLASIIKQRPLSSFLKLLLIKTIGINILCKINRLIHQMMRRS